MEQKYSLRSPAVKRLMREAKELREPTELYYAQPLEDNLFEWHFCVRGPPDSNFAGGRYHGRITLPPEYPMKPPSIMILTPNGRFETGKKICLSMSAHHPETWQPSWSIRTVLMAIIGFMPSKGAGAIGSLDYTPQERKVLAKKSLEWKCDVCNSCNATALLETSDNSKTAQEAVKEAAELAAQISFKGENEKEKEKRTSVSSSSQSSQPTTPTSSTTPAQVNTTMPAGMANNMIGAIPPYYAAFQYPYNPTGYPVPNGPLPTNQMTSPPPVASNQVWSSPGQSSANSASTLRQRSTVSPQVSSAPPSSSSASQRPHVTQTSMASLLFMWFLGICIVALLARRLFSTS